MRAWRSHQTGGPDTLVLDTDLAPPAAGPGQVVVAVSATALNYPDLLVIQDLYQARPPRPFAPGLEVAGRVTAVGDGVQGLAVGDRVIGVVPHGGLSEQLAIPASDCLPLPDGVDDAAGAALRLTYGTSHYALRDRARLAAGETLVVLGAAGGVGLAAVQLGKAMGATVIAAASSPEKAAIAKDNGADAVVVYPARLDDPAAAKALTADIRAACQAVSSKGEADVIYDPMGGAYAEPAFRALGWRGRYLVVGFTAGIPKLPLNLTLLKDGAALGVFYGEFTRRDPALNRTYLREIMGWLANGTIRPHIGLRLPFNRAPEGLTALGARQAVGKIVVEVG
ncbi:MULTISPECIES: NADPH:quinone oxidoreductase family protein [Nitrospirillum]|uniref:NADPH:quinone reductase-like Zn-dependent oxidoreductase n=1 Tax=Nitrospirillum amazonense TaxID=28077 RepID=A0A560F5J7_9PROT|nr:NADPH:quinone oxidoreductase family protein [Nitrospirillum amazonense]MEC4589899.1 NADPH:quinone oxidoreductase family protein [Nitrospirillum amazonense]TWB16815.1 NADPH:quinone reductase-like Zn-dependent oxidoreductase [Nitrospirillum amazonense]